MFTIEKEDGREAHLKRSSIFNKLKKKNYN